MRFAGNLTLAAVSASLSLLGLTGCKEDKNGGSSSDGLKGPRGIIQGQLINALTLEPIDLRSDAAKDGGVQIKVATKVHNADKRSVDKNKPASVATRMGEYYFTNIPVGESLPITAYVEGYRPFKGMISVESRSPCGNYSATKNEKIERNPGFALDDQGNQVMTFGSPCTEEELKLYYKQTPIQVANIYLYPEGGPEVSPLEVFLNIKGEGLAQKRVNLFAQNLNSINNTGSNRTERGMSPHVDNDFFIIPTGKQPVLSAQTDANGIAKFEGKDLVLGGKYRVVAYNDDEGYDDGIGATEKTVTIGLNRSSGLALANNPNFLNFELTHANTEIKVTYASNEVQKSNQKGELVLKFDRQIEIVPGTIDDIKAELVGAIDIDLREDIFNNRKTDSVLINGKIENFEPTDTLVLTPQFFKNQTPDIKLEPGLKVKYSGIQIRPFTRPIQSAPSTLANLKLSSGGTVNMEVSFYGTETFAIFEELRIKEEIISVAANGSINDLGITAYDTDNKAYRDLKISLSIGKGDGKILVNYKDLEGKAQKFEISNGGQFPSAEFYTDENGKIKLLDLDGLENSPRLEVTSLSWKVGRETEHILNVAYDDMIEKNGIKKIKANVR